jgi:hypothetical protein
MKQISLGLNLSTKKTRKCEFLDEMERVVPWKALVQIIEPYWLNSKTGRPPFAIETMLRIHYLQGGAATARRSSAPAGTTRAPRDRLDRRGSALEDRQRDHPPRRLGLQRIGPRRVEHLLVLRSGEHVTLGTDLACETLFAEALCRRPGCALVQEAAGRRMPTGV